MSSIITTYEVLKYSIAEREYPKDKIERYKELVELSYFRSVLGKDFYDAIKAVVVDWSLIEEWEEGSYSQNDKVFWNGDVYNSKVNTNTEEPSLTATNWELAKKISTTELDFLWKTYLGQIIANKIILHTAILDTYRATGKGLGVSTEDSSNFNALSDKEVSAWYRQTQNLVDIMQGEMIEYIKDQYKKFTEDPGTGYDYSEVIFIEDCSIEKQNGNPSNRTFNFRY